MADANSSNRLLKIKKLPVYSNTELGFIAASSAIQALRAPHENNKGLLGVFRVFGEAVELPYALPNGDYLDLISKKGGSG